ncbi:MAG: flavin reductase family protein [Planctomycetota bacterium]
MAKVVLDRAFRPVYPSPAGLITSVAADGTPNIITLGETFNLSIGLGDHPVVVGVAIAPARYSHELIQAAGEFGLCLPTAEMVEVVDRCGTCSGREVGDKFAHVGLTPVAATRIQAPLIAECPVCLECTLLDVIPTGDHDLFRGEVVAEHVEESCLDADGRIAIERLNPLVYVLGQYWGIGEHLGSHGYTRKKEG